MGGYGYMYRTVATYNTVLRDESRSSGPAIRPFVPFVPDTSTSSITSPSDSKGYVTKKTIVPVGSRPPSPCSGDDDSNKRSSPSPAVAYTSRDRDDDQWHRRQTSPVGDSPRKVDDFLTKVQNEASRDRDPAIARSSPVSSTDWRQSPPLTPTPTPNYNGPNNGYGGDYGQKKGRNPTIPSARRDDNYYDGYDQGANGYGKEGHRPIGSTPRNGNYDGYNGGNGYGNYNNNTTPPRNDAYDGYNGGNYSNREGHRPTGTSPTRNGNNYYDGNDNGSNGYGNHINKEGKKPNYYDRPENYPYPASVSVLEPNKISTTGSGAGWNSRDSRPILGSSGSWTAPPRKGTQISEPTSDIGKAMELLKEAAKLASNPSNGHGHGHGHEPTSKVDKAMELVKEAERLKKINVSGAPPKSTVPTYYNYKDDYGETIDSREATRRYGNFNFPSSQQRTSPSEVTFIDGIDRDRDRKGDYGGNYIDSSRNSTTTRSVPVPTIDSRKAEKLFYGRRI